MVLGQACEMHYSKQPLWVGRLAGEVGGPTFQSWDRPVHPKLLVTSYALSSLTYFGPYQIWRTLISRMLISHGLFVHFFVIWSHTIQDLSYEVLCRYTLWSPTSRPFNQGCKKRPWILTSLGRSLALQALFLEVNNSEPLYNVYIYIYNTYIHTCMHLGKL